jgi:hypothetical protein
MGRGRNSYGSVTGRLSQELFSLCFALLIVVEHGPKNKQVNFPFVAKERQAILTSGFPCSALTGSFIFQVKGGGQCQSFILETGTELGL